MQAHAQRPSLVNEGGLIVGNTASREKSRFCHSCANGSPLPSPRGGEESFSSRASLSIDQGATAMNTVQTEIAAAYNATQTDDAIISEALSILNKRMRQHGEAMSSPNMVKNYLRLKLDGLEHEVFCVLFLDSQNRVIEFEELFRGTLNQASVYPREVVKRALAHNAAAVILAHNHPSGESEPSKADTVLTDQLKNALSLVDVKVLDHFIVGDTVLSFAERGLI